MSFGFIMTRHVSCIKTNKYWNQNVKLLRLYILYDKLLLLMITVIINL